MNAFDRRVMIRELLTKNKMIQVRALGEALHVSEVCVRRDLAFLEAQGLVSRVHGGAMLADRAPSPQPYAIKALQHAEEKAAIGAKAASLLAPGEHVILDSGSTVLEVARCLRAEGMPGERETTVISGSLPVIQLLSNRPGINIIVIGGLFLPIYQTVAGPQATHFLHNLNADRFIMATDGLTLERGFTTDHPLEAEVMRAMASVARKTIVVADSSKIGKIGFVTVLQANQVQCLVTDAGAPQDFVRQLEEMGVRVEIA